MSRVLICLLAALTLSGTVHAQTLELSTSGVPLDRVIAIVNEGVVLQSQLEGQIDQVMGRLRDQNAQMPPADVLRQQVLERLVLQEIQIQRAQHLGVQVSDEMLNEALRDVAKRNGLPFEQMPDALASQGVDYASYRDDMRREISISMLRQRDVFPRIYVSPRELDQALQRQSLQADENAEFDVSHILLSLPESTTAEQMASVEKLAADIHDRASAGEDFGQLALANSQAQSALERGKLGWRRLNQLPQFIADLVAGMKPGEVANPVRTPTGFHIVRLDETRGASTGPMLVEQIHARHILLRPNEVQDDATTRQRLTALRDRILAGEDFGALASVTSEDPGSASRGGDLGWSSPGTFDPEFEAVLATLEPDQISEPFRTQFGWHIIQLQGKRTFDQSDAVRRQRVLTALRESKVDEETELWLRRLRDEAYVEIRNL
ncbi:MAG: molecular chaperone SurA [Gammaproteobacteria bacterium]|nr:molecular chaperone SurA [Gammaproteobacteria bacterium]